MTSDYQGIPLQYFIQTFVLGTEDAQTRNTLNPKLQKPYTGNPNL